MINPTEKDIGRGVIYVPTGEPGVIRSMNETFVFVLYSGSTPQGTRREDLAWEFEEGR